jgi:hypothetical protein
MAFPSSSSRSNPSFGWTRGSIALINAAGLVGLALGGFMMGVVADRSRIAKSRPRVKTGVARSA